MKRKPPAVKKGRRKPAIGAAAPAPYHERLASEQLAVYKRDIGTFITTYRQRTVMGGPPRQTLFFFPGGMACQLWRSKEKFDPRHPNGDLGGYDRLWLDCWTFFGNAEELGMQQDAQGFF